MKVTLRQAHKIVDKINAKIKAITPELTVDLNVWELSDAESVAAKIAGRLEQLNQEIDLRTDLECTRYEIRKAIGLANQKEVDELVAQRKLIVDSLAMNRTLVDGFNSRYSLSCDAVAAQAAQTRTSTNVYGGSTITVNLLDQPEIDRLKQVMSTIQMSLEKIEDALSTANNDRDNMVDLTEWVETLRKGQIIE